MKIEDTCQTRSAAVGMALPHQYDIPVEWWYDAEENIGGDYAKAAIVIQAKHVTRLRCVCGEEIDRKIVR